MSLTLIAAAVAVKLSELPMILLVQLQLIGVQDRAQSAPCYAAKNDFVNAFKPLFEWAFGNIRGIAPWIAGGLAIVIGVIILVKVLGRDDVSVWVKAVGWLFVGLAIVLFVPAVMFTVANTAPAGGGC